MRSPAMPYDGSVQMDRLTDGDDAQRLVPDQSTETRKANKR